MKKIKLLIPALACAALAVGPMISITSCNEQEDHEIVSYTVANNMLYGINKENELFKLSSQQFEDLRGCYFVVLADGSLKLYDKAEQDEKDIHDIAGFMEAADKGQIWGYELYLINGEYKFGHTPQLHRTMNTFYIKGLNNYDGSKMSSIYGYTGQDNPRDIGKVSLNKYLNLLQFVNVNILGSLHTDTGWDKWGITGNVNMMYFMSCNFIGKVVIDANTLYFTACKFDSTCVELGTLEGDLGKTDYCIWLYNAQYAYFYGCELYSRGKAIKILKNEAKPAAFNPDQYVINACNFYIKDVPQGEAKENKYCVEIDPLSMYDKTIRPLFIYYKDVNNFSCKEDETPGELYTKYINLDEESSTNKYRGLVGATNNPVLDISGKLYSSDDYVEGKNAYIQFSGILPSW